ncbi:glutathione S-transferase family protein [Curvibacter sp. CHRR-16]|uniref:glutathione S-transferase n=1 Tax=Curvibacter sp. CHRR-16 TaxID=2835872 RepID=UPI001BD97AB4|nr:glutathione S-transferase family protein [Curvibacter sp. CHRR-16]MBT0570968.1 glutathione S-transferase family protein [Curvibacter sp. CHRR-16]
MTQLTLTYFDMPGGRGEPIRLALHLGGIAFEDKRFAYADFAQVRATTPLGQVPTLEVDGVQVTQSDALLRYAGKLAGLYPTDPFQALLCDEVLQGAEDANIKLSATFGLQGDALKQAREALAHPETGALPKYLRWLQSLLLAHGGQFFADNRLTIADLKVLVWVNGLRSGRLDHIPLDMVNTAAPELLAYLNRIAATPAIAAWYARFKG